MISRSCARRLGLRMDAIWHATSYHRDRDNRAPVFSAYRPTVTLASCPPKPGPPSCPVAITTSPTSTTTPRLNSLPLLAPALPLLALTKAVRLVHETKPPSNLPVCHLSETQVTVRGPVHKNPSHIASRPAPALTHIGRPVHIDNRSLGATTGQRHGHLDTDLRSVIATVPNGGSPISRPASTRFINSSVHLPRPRLPSVDPAFPVRLSGPGPC